MRYPIECLEGFLGPKVPDSLLTDRKHLDDPLWAAQSPAKSSRANR